MRFWRRRGRRRGRIPVRRRGKILGRRRGRFLGIIPARKRQRCGRNERVSLIELTSTPIKYAWSTMIRI
tara:strand:- start:374 stop:580 length:207 start_codon:yes stop_codon:yes gene_type:complete